MSSSTRGSATAGPRLALSNDAGPTTRQPGRYAEPVANPSDVEARLTALETRMQEVASDAAAARHLAAARDRDLDDLGIKVDVNRSAINALGVQTAAGFAEMRAKFDQIDVRFDQIDAKFDQVDNGFIEMRGRFDQTAAGMAQIVELLTRRDDQP